MEVVQQGCFKIVFTENLFRFDAEKFEDVGVFDDIHGLWLVGNSVSHQPEKLSLSVESPRRSKSSELVWRFSSRTDQTPLTHSIS